MSEGVFQRKLHDSGISCRCYLTKRVEVKNRRRIVHDETVCDVEGFGSKFHSLAFTDLKNPGDGHVELPHARTRNATPPDSPKRTERRQSECCGIQKTARRSVTVGVG